VITGAGGGLGRALTRAFAAEGARLALLDISPSFERAQTLAAKLNVETSVLRCDLRSERQIRSAFEDIRKRWGQINVLINNAGVEGPTKSADKISLNEWEETLRVNLTGAFLCAREAIPLMRREGGCIIQIGSVAGRVAYKLRLPYAVSKAALEALTRGLAGEFGRYGIRANLVAPGPIVGPRMERIIRKRARATGRSEEVIREGYLRGSALGTMVDPQDVARAVLFLCSPVGAHISGACLEVSAAWQSTAF
jgi:NAD(P)-dependent dehydrogenase (short-subunit alcohol dehydrogenase family)